MNSTQYFRFSRPEWLAILAVALGYFVDVYDILLFSAVRKASLLAIGVAETDLANVGLNLLNWQLLGMLLGGMLWGVLADKLGRRAVLFASIFVYSVANLANAYVDSVSIYTLLRFISGVGLAGELGAGIALLSENIAREKRTIATTIVATFGMLGGVTAALVASKTGWQSSYLIGGGMGVALLLFRFAVADSIIFKSLSGNVRKGSLSQLFTQPSLLKKYLLCILVGTPVYVFAGIFITLSPEFGKQLGLQQAPSAATALIYFYVALTLFDAIAGIMSKWLRSRKKVLLFFLGLQLIAMLVYLFVPLASETDFYWRCGLLGASLGYWSVLVTNAAEQFGTNLRGTVSTSVPNWVRGISIPISMYLFKPLAAQWGIVAAGAIAGFFALALGLIAALLLKDQFENDADFVEN